jgi:D-threo-aldose 1-dehydrogenase
VGVAQDGRRSTGVNPAFELVPLGRTALEATRLGFGAATIGGLFTPVSDDDAIATVDRAYELGIRYFDVAPLYGYGLSEQRVGAALARRPRDSYVLSTKVGRRLVARDLITADMDVDRQEVDGREDFYFGEGMPSVRPVFDYSFDGTLRSVEESLERLGADRLDMLLIHDPDDHLDAAMTVAYEALRRLRDEGVVRAIGVGMNHAHLLARFAERCDLDLVLIAGRYTLLQQEALNELLPTCERRRIAVVVAGVMNSGILADPKPGSRLNYMPADGALVARAIRLRDIAASHGVSLKAVALQFALAHPAVACMVAGVRTVAQLEEYPALFAERIPQDLWAELRTEGLLPVVAPVPTA